MGFPERAVSSRSNRRLVSLLAAASLAIMGLVGSATPVFAVVGHCGTAYVTLYDGESQGTANRTFCYGINDSDIESESGNVMGPLLDGSPVVYKDDFDTSATSSGVNSVLFYTANGDYSVCMYTGKAYAGDLLIIHHTSTFTGTSYDTNLLYEETTMGSLKIVAGNGSTC